MPVLHYLNYSTTIHKSYYMITLPVYILSHKKHLLLYYYLGFLLFSFLQHFQVLVKLWSAVNWIWASSHLTVSATGRRWSRVPSWLLLSQVLRANTTPKCSLWPVLATGVLYVFRGRASATHARNRPEIVYSHWVFVPSYQTCPYMVHLVCAYFS
jgi:hypothetical protein